MSKLGFLSYINALVVNSPHNKSLLAEKIGVSRSTLHRILSGEVEESKLSTLVNLAYALGVHPFELIRRYFAASPVQSHSTQHTAHSTQHTAHSTQHTAHSTQHTAHSTHLSCLIFWLKSTAAQ